MIAYNVFLRRYKINVSFLGPGGGGTCALPGVMNTAHMIFDARLLQYVHKIYGSGQAKNVFERAQNDLRIYITLH